MGRGRGACVVLWEGAIVMGGGGERSYSVGRGMGACVVLWE